LKWVEISQLENYAFPAANRPIITALQLPQKMLVTGPARTQEDYLAAIQIAIAAGASGVQLRCPNMLPDIYLSLAEDCQRLCDEHKVPLFLNTSPDIFQHSRGSGLHLNRHWLRQLTARPVAADILLGASCHDAEELQMAEALG